VYANRTWLASLMAVVAASLTACGFRRAEHPRMRHKSRFHRMLAPPWFGSSRPMLSAGVCSGAGRGQGAAFEDFGEELGGGGEMFLVPGPYAPPQVGNADLKLVAVVTYGGVDEGALVDS
jgi:hypothetical protein